MAATACRRTVPWPMRVDQWNNRSNFGVTQQPRGQVLQNHIQPGKESLDHLPSSAGTGDAVTFRNNSAGV
jgi:hypothetical protein